MLLKLFKRFVVAQYLYGIMNSMGKYFALFLVNFVFFSSFIFAQDMKPQTRNNPLATKPIPASLKKVLLDDKTDEHLYIAGKFYCHNFASQFFLQNSSLVKNMDTFDIEAMGSEWGTIILRLAETEKLPIYYVSLSNAEYGFYHAINAYLIDPAKPEALESYLFIEPQSDEVFFSLKDIYDRYRRYYDKTDAEEILKVSIGTFDAYKSNSVSGIYQSWNSSLYNFEAKFK